METDGELYDIHTLCRICLERLHTEASYDLFVVPGLAKKLSVCVEIEVERNDGYPKCICGVCYTRLNDLHEFKKLCFDAAERFQTMIDSKVFVATSNHLVTTPDLFMLDALPATVEATTVGDDDEPLNFDPLLNYKIDLMPETDDVFKMLERVDQDVTEYKIDNKNNNDDDDGFDEEDDQPLSMRIKQNELIRKSKKSSKKVIILEETKKNNKSGKKAAKIEETKSSCNKNAKMMENVDNINKSIEKMKMHNIETLSTDNNNIKEFYDDFADDDYDDDDDYDEDEDDDDSSSDDEENADNVNKNLNGTNELQIEAGAQKEKPKRKRNPNRQAIIECHICHKKFKKVIRYHDHMKYHNDKLPHQCAVPTCNRGFTTANGLRLHVEHSHSETIEMHPCPEVGCDKKFPRTRQLNWHLKTVHKHSNNYDPKTYPCTGCDKIFRCPMSLKKHMYKHDGKELPFPCNICGKRFVINSALKDHLMRHAGIKNYVCPYCGVGKTTRQEWNTHVAIHTHEKQFKCDLCPHASHNKQNLRMHIKIVHEKIKDYACQYCGKTFGKSNACKMHEMTHTGEKRCECKVCGKRFLYPKSLTKHLKTHEKRVLRAIEVYRKRQTDIGATTNDNNNSNSANDVTAPPLPELPEMEDHSKETHQKAANEILKVCAESVATIPKDYRRVERVDIMELAGTAVNPISSVAVPSWSPQINFMMKEGPHICPDCGQGFNGLGNLKRHHRIVHEGVKDFACRFCHKRFAKSQTLKHHEMTHTGEKPHECKDCGKRFIQSVALKRHMKVHGNVPLPKPEIPASVYEERVLEACEELELRERAELDAKNKEEEQRAVLAEVAKEQLNELEQTQLEARAKSYEIPTNIPITLAKDLAKGNVLK